MLFSSKDQIAAAALARKLPTVFGYEPHVVAGGLVSYGIDLIQCSYSVSNFVDKILHGAKPGDLPVEFPTKMLLAVNLKTARALGITISPTILSRPGHRINPRENDWRPTGLELSLSHDIIVKQHGGAINVPYQVNS